MTESTIQAIDVVTLTVPSHPKFLYIVRSALYPLALNAGFSKKEARKIVLAVDEACSNIIKYAYAGDQSKTISLAVSCEQTRFRVQLIDHGKHVDPSTIAGRSLDDVRPGGLGTHFIGTVFDTVTYEAQQDQGTILTLVKKRTG
jgi:anti-sigma regulatory factor (Ser/Thr protein kinase)